MGIIDIDEAVEILKTAGVVAFPSETVYGLGAIATNPKAIKKVFDIKKRPADNPLICHFHSLRQIQDWGISLTKPAQLIFENFSPGPVSILLKLPENSSLKYATAGQPNIICRIPDQGITLNLITNLNIPIVGPSANTSGRPSGTNPEMILNDLGDKIDGVVDGGNSKIGLESTIIDCLSEGKITILRPGAVGKKELQKVFQENGMGDIQILEYQNTHSIIPGNKYTHYSPKVGVYRINSLSEIDLDTDYAILTTNEIIQKYSLQSDTTKKIHIQSIGSISDLQKMSTDLYSNLASLDQIGVKKVYFLPFELGNSSLGLALENRLSKVVIS